MNRVIEKIEQMKARIASRLQAGIITKEQVDQAHKNFDMEMDEYVRLQQLKSLAVISGVLTQEEGNTVYSFLGEVPSTFNRQPIEVKVVLTKMLAELLEKQN
jgi:hypothetical protein